MIDRISLSRRAVFGEGRGKGRKLQKNNILESASRRAIAHTTVSCPPASHACHSGALKVNGGGKGRGKEGKQVINVMYGAEGRERGQLGGRRCSDGARESAARKRKEEGKYSDGG